MAVPKKVAERISSGLKKFKTVLESVKAREPLMNNGYGVVRNP